MPDYIDQLISKHYAKPASAADPDFFDNRVRSLNAAPPGMTPVRNHKPELVTPAKEKLAERIRDIEYALAKQVPSMDAGSTICTIYGGIQLDTEGAARVARTVKAALELELTMLQKGLTRL